MGKRSAIKLLITNSRGKNSQEFTLNVLRRRADGYTRAGVNKIFTVAENCRALRVTALSASFVAQSD